MKVEVRMDDAGDRPVAINIDGLDFDIDYQKQCNDRIEWTIRIGSSYKKEFVVCDTCPLKNYGSGLTGCAWRVFV